MSERHISLHRPLMDYIEFWERLNLRSIPLITQVAHPGIRYKDPHHHFEGIESLSYHLEDRFEIFRRMKFKCTNFSWGERGGDNIAYMHWEFIAQRKNKDYQLSGVAELTFSEDSKIISHIDHWQSPENIFAKPTIKSTLIKILG